MQSEAQEKIIRKIADNGSCVIVGRSADYVLKDYENVVRVFVHAPMEFRIGRVREVYGDTLKEAKRAISAARTRQEPPIISISPACAGARPKTMS